MTSPYVPSLPNALAATAAHSPDPAARRTPLRADDPALIGAALATLAQGRQVLSLHPGPDLPAAQAPVVAVDLAARTFQLDCTYAPDAAALLAKPGAKRCVALGQGVRMQFVVGQAVAEAAGAPGWVSVPFPAELYQMGRRSFVRLMPPPDRPWRVLCRLDGRDHLLQVHDLSMGGLALRADARDAPVFKPGRVLHGVWLTLGAGRETNVSLEVRLVRRVVVRGLGPQLHLGCRFVDMAAAQQQALADAMAVLGRRYRGE